jgi:cyanophycinase
MKRKGTLIIIGGHEDHEGERLILKEIVALMSKGKLVLVTVASDEPEGYFEKYKASFADLGIGEMVELYVQHRHEAATPQVLAKLDGAKGVFFSGGDQLRITSQIGDTPVYHRIREIYEQGGVIAGTSAGASAMSEIMLAKGPNSSSSKVGDQHMSSGLGLVPNVIIDQHFAERGRIGRLIGAVAQNPRLLGIGIDEDTAIVVEGDRFRVIGTGAVYVVDATDVSESNIADAEPDDTLSIYGLQMHVLGSGSRFNLKDREPQTALPTRSSA